MLNQFTESFLRGPSGLSAGMNIEVRRPATAEWIHLLGMDQIPPSKRPEPVTQWKPKAKDLQFYRVIQNIQANEITLDVPLTCALEAQYGGGTLVAQEAADTVAECGVENLRGESEYHGPVDEAHAWTLVDLVRARNSWVHQVTAVNFGSSCVNVRSDSYSITVEYCECLDPISQITGGRRYSFPANGRLTLVQHCYARNGRHDFVVGGARVAGPIVYYDCKADLAHADSGPHQRWSVGVLYDNVTVNAPLIKPESGVGLNIRNRGNAGTGQGWAGANQIAWNCSAKEMIIEQPPSAQNWAIGCTAIKHAGNAYWESFGTQVEPHSLYECQLQDRLSLKSTPASHKQVNSENPSPLQQTRLAAGGK